MSSQATRTANGNCVRTHMWWNWMRPGCIQRSLSWKLGRFLAVFQVIRGLTAPAGSPRIAPSKQSEVASYD